MAPVAPFIAEAIYRRLIDEAVADCESVHLEEFPSAAHATFQFREPGLEEKMGLVRDIVVAGRALRSAKAIKVRQPLRRLLVVADEEKRNALMAGAGLIKDELNIKAVELIASADALTVPRAEPIFKALGPKFGKNANAVADVIRQLTPEQIRQLEADGTLAVTLSGATLTLDKDDVRIKAEQAPGLAISTEGEWTVALDTNLDEVLINEGLAREFVNRVQNMRKDAGFDIVDRIRIHYETSEPMHRALQHSLHYVKSETLAETLERVGETSASVRLSAHAEVSVEPLTSSRDGVAKPNAPREEWEINGDKTIICIERI
jgi:isoleucyl-tRNA synthetase